MGAFPRKGHHDTTGTDRNRESLAKGPRGTGGNARKGRFQRMGKCPGMGEGELDTGHPRAAPAVDLSPHPPAHWGQRCLDRTMDTGWRGKQPMTWPPGFFLSYCCFKTSGQFSAWLSLSHHLDLGPCHVPKMSPHIKGSLHPQSLSHSLTA